MVLNMQNPGGSPTVPMTPFNVLMSAPGGPAPRRIEVLFEFSNFTPDPDHPPAIYGLRLTP